MIEINIFIFLLLWQALFSFKSEEDSHGTEKDQTAPAR